MLEREARLRLGNAHVLVHSDHEARLEELGLFERLGGWVSGWGEWVGGAWEADGSPTCTAFHNLLLITGAAKDV